MAHSTHYEELTPEEFHKRIDAAPIAYLPLGTLEWHGEHLPLGSDGIQSRRFFEQLAERVGGIVLPMLFLGPDTRESQDGDSYVGMDIHSFGDEPRQLAGSAYWADDELFDELLATVLGQLARAGFEVVVAHGHGPSTHHFQDRTDDWSDEFGLELFTCWRDDEFEQSDGQGIMTDHAAANETSLVMALRPDLVEMDRLPDDRNEWPLGIGGKDPRNHASQERGWSAITEQADRMATLLETALDHE